MHVLYNLNDFMTIYLSLVNEFMSCYKEPSLDLVFKLKSQGMSGAKQR